MSDAPGSLTAALVALQAQLPRIVKGDEAQVGTRTYRYANLSAITDAVFPIMAKLGLAWICRPTMEGEQFVLAFSLRYVNGEHMDGAYPLPTSGTPQQIGSAITYARRYALTAVTGIAPVEDDDDAAAAERAAQTDAERDQAGLMTKAQQREHAALRRLESPRKADRSSGPLENDPWTEGAYPHNQWGAPEDQIGSSTKDQHTRLGILYGQLAIKERADRLDDMTNRTGRKISSARDLSYLEAQQAIKELSDLIAKAAD